MWPIHQLCGIINISLKAPFSIDRGKTNIHPQHFTQKLHKSLTCVEDEREIRSKSRVSCEHEWNISHISTYIDRAHTLHLPLTLIAKNTENSEFPFCCSQSRFSIVGLIFSTKTKFYFDASKQYANRAKWCVHERWRTRENEIDFTVHRAKQQSQFQMPRLRQSDIKREIQHASIYSIYFEGVRGIGKGRFIISLNMCEIRDLQFYNHVKMSNRTTLNVKQQLDQC